MDFRESCRGFLQTLMARKSLDFASVWVRAAHRPEVGRVAAGDLVLAFAHPSFRATRDRLPSEHALVRRVASERHFSVSHGDGDWPQIVTEQVGDVGTFAVYRLGDVGLLKLYSMSRSEPFSGVELGKLHHVVEKFAVSLRGCLDHERVRLAERRSREVEVQMLRAQKLESLGVLAGGIAHDFNNLLTAVLGNAELVRVDPETAGSSVANIVDAARRASELCDQLLAYAGRGMRAIEGRRHRRHRRRDAAAHVGLDPQGSARRTRRRRQPAGRAGGCFTAATGRAQPDHERRRGDRRGRRPARRDRRDRAVGRPVARLHGGRWLFARTVRIGRGGGLRLRHGRGHAGAAVRAVLLDEVPGAWSGHGGRARHRSAPSRSDLGALAVGARHQHARDVAGFARAPRPVAASDATDCRAVVRQRAGRR